MKRTLALRAAAFCVFLRIGPEKTDGLERRRVRSGTAETGGESHRDLELSNVPTMFSLVFPLVFILSFT